MVFVIVVFVLQRLKPLWSGVIISAYRRRRTVEANEMNHRKAKRDMPESTLNSYSGDPSPALAGVCFHCALHQPLQPYQPLGSPHGCRAFVCGKHGDLLQSPGAEKLAVNPFGSAMNGCL